MHTIYSVCNSKGNVLQLTPRLELVYIYLYTRMYFTGVNHRPHMLSIWKRKRRREVCIFYRGLALRNDNPAPRSATDMNALQTTRTQETFQDEWKNATKKIYTKVVCIVYIKDKERRAVTEGKKAEVDEWKVVMEERIKSIEQDQKLMFVDTSGLDDKAKPHVELCRYQVLGGFMGGMVGAMSGMCDTMRGFIGAMGGGMGGAMDDNGNNGANDVNGGIGEESFNGEEASHEDNASTSNGNGGNATLEAMHSCSVHLCFCLRCKLIVV